MGFWIFAGARDPAADDRLCAWWTRPPALAAWIVEKFWAWTDHDGPLEDVLTRDELLDNLMLYWLPGTGRLGGTAVLGEHPQVNEWIAGTSVNRSRSRSGARCSRASSSGRRGGGREKRFADIRYWNEPARGGHFAAFEQPELFVEEVRAFFRLVRD